MNKFFLLFPIMFLVLVGVVLGNLVVTPRSSDLDVEWYNSHVFQLSLWNNGSSQIENLTFSNVSFFSFPGSINLSANESRQISFSVLTNELFSRDFTSVLSFFYRVNVSPPVKTVEVNISGWGFSNNNVSVFVNDSVKWNNLNSFDVELKDLGNSGFSPVVVPAGSSVELPYTSIVNQSFYVLPGGFMGSLWVGERLGWSFAHSSVDDVPVLFHLDSVLGEGTLSVALLSTDIVVDNNGTYREALIEVRNNDQNLVVRNVSISADRWVGNFSPNRFSLNPGGIMRVLFNITPVVFRTNETNATSVVNLLVTSDNAGNTSKKVNVFIRYQNLDLLNYNGSVYNLLVLGVNETIEACIQHMNDVGYERCQELKRFGVNNTVVKEVMAQYQIPESEMLDIRRSLWLQGNVSERLENKMNLYMDRVDMLNLRVDNNTRELSNLSVFVVDTQAERLEKIRSLRTLFWTIFSILLLFLLVLGVNYAVVMSNYYELRVRARQS